MECLSTATLPSMREASWRCVRGGGGGSADSWWDTNCEVVDVDGGELGHTNSEGGANSKEVSQIPMRRSVGPQPRNLTAKPLFLV